jgi:hypothetical protein
MTAIDKFRTDLENWFEKNNLDKLGFVWDEDYAYDRKDKVIHIGVAEVPGIGAWFEEFLIECGCKYQGILEQAASFLHELGHHYTLHMFSEEELMMYKLIKSYDDDALTDKDFLWLYWKTADEFAANMWEVGFINNHPDAVQDLIDIYFEDWNDMWIDADPFELIGEAL